MSEKWCVQFGSNNPEIHPIDDVDGDTVIADVNPDNTDSPEQAEANAYLIAAAPDLLNACKEFVFLEKTNMTKKQVQLRIDIAKIAIAKTNTPSNT